MVFMYAVTMVNDFTTYRGARKGYSSIIKAGSKHIMRVKIFVFVFKMSKSHLLQTCR